MASRFGQWKFSIPVSVALTLGASGLRAQDGEAFRIDDATPTPAATEPARLPVEPEEGEPEVVNERYPNRTVRISRQVIQDEQGNYVNHGFWKQFDPQGNLLADGNYRYDRREGVWNHRLFANETPLLATSPYSQFAGPLVSQATFQDGKLDGKWTIFDAKQHRISEWEFVAGQRQGESTWWHPNGRIMQRVTYRDGAIDGQFTSWALDGTAVKNETYENGRRIASKVEYYPNSQQKKTEGLYLFAKIVVKETDDWWTSRPAVFTTEGKDERHGSWTMWHPNGQLQQQGEFNHDIAVGRFTWWYANGQKSLEGDYEKGKPHGSWIWWHKNGVKMTSGEYVDGNPVGPWTWWRDNGKVAQRADFSDEHSDVAELPEIDLAIPQPSEDQSSRRSPVQR